MRTKYFKFMFNSDHPILFANNNTSKFKTTLLHEHDPSLGNLNSIPV